LTEVSVSIPRWNTNEEEDDDESELAMNLLFRKFFLLSSAVGAIVWMADSFTIPRNQDVTLSSFLVEESGRRRSHVAAVASNSSSVLSFFVYPSCDVHQPVHMVQLADEDDTNLEYGWISRQTLDRQVVICGGEIVVAQNTVVDYGHNKQRYKARLFFLPSVPTINDVPVASIALEGDVVVHHLVNVRSTHVLAICKVYMNEGNNYNVEERDVLNEVVGHWFGDGSAETSSRKIASLGILVDVLSRKEIRRLRLVEDLSSIAEIGSEGTLPLLVAAFEGTVAASAWWSGVVMTGDAVRELDRHIKATDMTVDGQAIAKKIKKKGVKKNVKKDGFARGMSLRG
jgi:hypothetical protein